ncbi:hypothetical protein [Rhodoplanes roseus]|uniref:Uncharacterized protein n=1 Tax=Rhodoplanes roseus TaxID=29409 RepID=A0A327L189_9BRAD|nr:hypothetical protein [Rhodoplanes roseus]RAI44024.1 hypothetical protein CH341_11380 [Rhodoplanes roseus]
MLDTVTKPASRRIAWQNVVTVLGATVLIGAEVFGAAFAGGWAMASLFGLGLVGEYIAQTIFMLLGLVVMVQFVRGGMKIEPFTTRH